VTGTPNEPPVAIANADKQVVDIEEVVHFDATDSYDPEDGEVHNYAWDLDGDGMYVDAFFGEVDWYYDVPGLYQVDVQVCDIPGLCDRLDEKILIQVMEGGNQPPVAVAIANKTYCFEGETIEFDGSQSYDPEDGFPSSWAWDLDEDGEYDDGPFILVSKQFDTEGVYCVDLKVTDSEGAFDTLDDPICITVLPPGSNFPPEAIADVNCSFPLVDQEIEFTNESIDYDGEIVTWEWNFDDGTGWHDYSSTQGNVTWDYGDEGVYNADLRVTDNLDATDQLDTPITIYASRPEFTVPSGPPSCGSVGTHLFTAANQLPITNTTTSTRDIAFLSSGFVLMVFSNNLVQTDLLNIVDPPVMTNAAWIQSIDTTKSDFVALSGLTDGLIEVYTAQGVAQDMELVPVAEVDVGQPVNAITFDNESNMWVYTGGEIRAYITPNYTLDPCKIFEVPDIEALGEVQDMDFNIWNHSLYLVIDDGANGAVAEVDYLGNVAGTISNVLQGPSRYFDIVIDKNVMDPDTPGCRIVVAGGVSEAYMTRLDADLTVLARASFGYWGLRSIALDKGPSNIIMGIEDCCIGWVDTFGPPRDWTDTD
jgi:PKD repeat protein